jgi:hypothetical protein
MLKIIKERTPITIKEYYIEFNYKDDSEAGFCFPATPSGAPDFACMAPEAVANYKACLADDRLTEGEFEAHIRTYIEPATGICSCGKEIVLDCDHDGAVQCECGRWYNLFGQSLIDPKYWYRDEDEYYSDMPEEDYE